MLLILTKILSVELFSKLSKIIIRNNCKMPLYSRLIPHRNTSYLCCQSEADSVVKGSLEVLDTIVCYSNISQQTMSIFVSALCRTVCLEPYNAVSWKVLCFQSLHAAVSIITSNNWKLNSVPNFIPSFLRILSNRSVRGTHWLVYSPLSPLLAFTEELFFET